MIRKPILTILKDPSYHISEAQFSHMKMLAKSTVVYHTKKSESQLVVTLRSNKHDKLGSYIAKNIPQVIDTPPIYLNQKLYQVSPILILPSEENASADWTVLHELCHLFSIGTYGRIRTNPRCADIYYHRFGINEYRYTVTGSGLKCFQCNQNNGLNELVNDFVTWHILQRLYQKEIKPIYKGIIRFHDYLKQYCSPEIQEQDFIGWYFTGNVAHIQTYLLNKKYEDYQSLYLALEKAD